MLDPSDRMSSAATQPRIGFIGSMNAMPMAYALKFRRDGFDVRYAVEAPREDVLMRPEHQYSRDITWPYADWIIEREHRYSLVAHAFAPRTYADITEAMSDRDIVFLNDFGLALASRLPARTLCVALSSGSDIDVYCDPHTAWRSMLSTRRKLLMPLRYVLERLRVFHQRRGLRRCEVACYFPEGLNPAGDAIVAEMARRRPGLRVVRRYDVNFESAGVRNVPVPQRPLRKILVPVRFNIRPPAASRFEYKGNDLIIAALGRYRARNPDIEVHLFDKGPPEDVALAREQIRALGLQESVVWHDQMPLSDLLALYADSDICFDQVGHHWMGAVGCYALYTGRPLIVNARLDVFGSLWGEDPPVLHADSVETIFAHLVRCEDQAFRNDLGTRAHRFAAEMLDTERVYRDLRTQVIDAWDTRRAAWGEN